MRLKDGVQIAGLRREMQPAIEAAQKAFAARNVECVITSALDGKHKSQSLHYLGLALDFRTRHVSEEARQEIALEIASELGGDFDVVLERTHLHVEYQPKSEIKVAHA